MEYIINQKIEELEETIKELKKMASYYLKKDDYTSLENIARQLYRNKYTLDIFKKIL